MKQKPDTTDNETQKRVHPFFPDSAPFPLGIFFWPVVTVVCCGVRDPAFQIIRFTWPFRLFDLQCRLFPNAGPRISNLASQKWSPNPYPSMFQRRPQCCIKLVCCNGFCFAPSTKKGWSFRWFEVMCFPYAVVVYVVVVLSKRVCVYSRPSKGIP